MLISVERFCHSIKKVAIVTGSRRIQQVAAGRSASLSRSIRCPDPRKSRYMGLCYVSLGEHENSEILISEKTKLPRRLNIRTHYDWFTLSLINLRYRAYFHLTRLGNLHGKQKSLRLLGRYWRCSLSLYMGLLVVFRTFCSTNSLLFATSSRDSDL